MQRPELTLSNEMADTQNSMQMTFSPTRNNNFNLTQGQEIETEIVQSHEQPEQQPEEGQSLDVVQKVMETLM